VLHEALDVLHAGMAGVAEPYRHLALDVERQPLLRALGDEVHVAADRPEEILAAAERAVFLRVEHAVLDQLTGLAHAVDVFRDPEQRVQVAQAALAVLHVRLHQVARLAGAAVPLLALGEFCGDELRGGALHDLLVEARDQFVIERAVADQVARLQHGGSDGHVGARLPDRLVDRSRGMADLQPHVPETIKNGFGDRFAPGGLLVGKQEQQVDVGFRGHQPAAVAAGGDDRHALGVGWHEAPVEMTRRRLVQQADDRIVQIAQPLGAAAPVPVLQQLRLRGRAPCREFAFQKLGDRCPEGVVPARELGGQRLDLGADAHGIELRLDRQGLVGDDGIHAHRITDGSSGVISL
jgi:hypothetical protein